MVNLQGIIHSTLKYTVTNTTISLKVNAKECIIECNTAFLIMAWFRPWPRGDEQCEYAFELDFHAKVVLKVRFSSLYNLWDLHIYLNPIVQASEKCRTLQSITIVIFKKDLTAWYWPQLSKTVLVYVKPDFNWWSCEGESLMMKIKMAPLTSLTWKWIVPLQGQTVEGSWYRYFPCKSTLKLLLLITRITVKSRLRPTQCCNASNTTSLLGPAKFPNWD